MYFDSLIINTNALLDLTSLITTPDTIIGIKDGNIRLIEQGTNYQNYKYKELIDLNGALLTPGLIDCHTHLIFAGNRAKEFKLRLDGVGYTEISKAGGGIKSTVKATRDTNKSELLSLALSRLKIMQSCGTTTIEVKSGYGLSLESEIKCLEIANELKQYSNIIPTFLGAHATPPEFVDRSDEYIDLIIEQMLPKVKELGLASAVDGFCENIGFSTAQMERLFEITFGS